MENTANMKLENLCEELGSVSTTFGANCLTSLSFKIVKIK